MAEENEDESQKTEEATERRLEEALKQGNILQSKEVTNFFMILALLVTIAILAPMMSKSLTFNLRKYIEMSYQYDMNLENIGEILKIIIFDFIKIVIMPLTIGSVAAIGAYLLQQGRFIFSSESMKPKLSKISPTAGLKRLFSMKSLMEFFKGILKIVIVSIACYSAISGKLNNVKQLHDFSVAGIMAFLMDLSTNIIIAAAIVTAFLAGMDYFYQRFEYYKSLRMSRQEIKDEYKLAEGSPEIKAKLRKLRQEKSRQRMMASVPKADVIITNPTHFAIALKYDPEEMEAPVLLAKAQDHMALQMREIAKKHDIIIYEDPPLARILFATMEPDDEVPVEHYKAVAEVIKFVFDKKNIKKRKKVNG